MLVHEKLHGAALIRLIKHPSFVALNGMPDRAYGHYAINADRRVLMKYNRSGPIHRFRITRDDVDRLRDDGRAVPRVFLVLLCKDAVCALNNKEIHKCLDFSPQKPGQQTLYVELRKGAPFQVWSKMTRPDRLEIDRRSYPDKLLE